MERQLLHHPICVLVQGWFANDLTEAFLRGLADDVKDRMAAFEQPAYLEDAIKLASQVVVLFYLCGNREDPRPLPASS